MLFEAGLIIARESPAMAAASAGETEEGFMEHLQKASDEAIDLIYEMFGMKSKAAEGGQEEEYVKAGPKSTFYLGDNLDGFNATAFRESLDSEWGSFYNSIMGFVSAVQWSEPWIIGLGVFHVVLLIAAVATRKNSNVQIALFGFILGLVYFAETLNGLGAKHWKSFSEQDYFDKNGVFTSIMLSSPLILISIVMLFYNLHSALRLMIDVQKMKIKARAREMSKEGGGQSSESKKSK